MYNYSVYVFDNNKNVEGKIRYVNKMVKNMYDLSISLIQNNMFIRKLERKLLCILCLGEILFYQSKLVGFFVFFQGSDRSFGR